MTFDVSVNNSLFQLTFAEITSVKTIGRDKRYCRKLTYEMPYLTYLSELYWRFEIRISCCLCQRGVCRFLKFAFRNMRH